VSRPQGGIVIRALWGLVLVASLLVGSAAMWTFRPLELAAPVVDLSVEPGMTPREVAQAWRDASVRAVTPLSPAPPLGNCWKKWCKAMSNWSPCA
jgi:hypothetical protein